MRTLYGLVQATIKFCREVRAAVWALKMARNFVDTCFFYNCINQWSFVVDTGKD